MLLTQLREEVLEANLELVRGGLVLYTFGNASGVDREQGLVVIKPSGVDYDKLKPEHMVVTDLEGNIIEGNLRPSSDLNTHTLLYREFGEIGAVVHTHSEFATSFAQAGLPIPAFGTTHADYFHGPVPVTAPLSDEAIEGQYVRETGAAIVARFRGGEDCAAIDPLAVPACLVHGHAPFVWGKTPHEAAHNAVVLEAVARMAYRTLSLEANTQEVSHTLLDRHYFRKHGAKATYGQSRKEHNL
ncbi:L-ribulose-5-phosphate 4-epimerase AraD [Tunturiibacter empetritectus]|uniref:L-ribulose-5-phosphate 4-epimerase n=2 Tax=Tunturiibacter TaxID=3154218 RepID=A0A852VB92_9BACT|nr:L-ribulose-5-phosphate 4-epimerase AraD [Edaphobacter lichenicola]NYF90188.1 L-ribulose-5-phosphate 4-epimerase [Edaphobacter lichenicola]